MFLINNVILTTLVINSENTTDSHIPFKSKNFGSSNIIMACSKNERNTDIIADNSPLFNAVKNDDAYILIPHSKNDIEYNLKP